jgi:hypothetical protein
MKFNAIALACVLVSSSALAQLSLPSIGGLTGGASSSASAGNEAAQQDQLVRAYVSANKEVLLAQSKMAEAVGLKESAAKLKSTADALGDGATKGNLSDADKIQSDSSKEISERLKAVAVALCVGHGLARHRRDQVHRPASAHHELRQHPEGIADAGHDQAQLGRLRGDELPGQRQERLRHAEHLDGLRQEPRHSGADRRHQGAGLVLIP